ncbi:MAG: hypothetical protein PVI41_10880, partial [Roseobacter sp.]
MRIFSTTATIAAGLLIGSVVVAQDIVWTLEGLEAPESAYFDEARNVLYVSNINGEPLAKDGNGYISRIGPDGQMQEAKWITGLDAPKGLVSDGATLYVSDIDRLVAIDIEKGRISGT